MLRSVFFLELENSKKIFLFENFGLGAWQPVFVILLTDMPNVSVNDFPFK